MTTSLVHPLEQEARQSGLDFRLVPKGEVTEELLDELLSLLQRAFARWPRMDPLVSAREHLRWKMASPASAFAAYIGRIDGKLRFVEIATGQGFFVRGRRLLRMKFIDLAVDPVEQGKGVASRALRYRHEVLQPRYDFLMPDTKLPVVVHLVQSHGARRLGNRIHTRYRILDARIFAATWLAGRSVRAPRALVLAALAGAASLGAARARSFSGPPGSVREVTTLDHRFDAFWNEARAPYEFILERSREYLGWRYLDRRAGPFRFFVLEHGDSILGYLALRLAHGRAQIADLLVLPGRDEVAEALVAEAVARARAAGAGGVACWLPARHPYGRALQRQGFLDSRRGADVLYQPVDAPLEELAFLDQPDAAVHYMQGDTDLL